MAPVASQLIYMTMGSLTDYLFGHDSQQTARLLLGQLFSAKENRFSYQFSEVAIQSNKIVGLLLAYPAHYLNSLRFTTLFQLIKVNDFSGLIRFLYRSFPLWFAQEAEDDEYFISNIAVIPEHHGQGVGKCLMDQAEKNAREQDFEKTSLVVDVENELAIRFYSHLGYEIFETLEFRKLKNQLVYYGFHRMAKVLG